MTFLKLLLKYTFIVCLFSIATQTNAQEYTYHHFGVEQGLPSSEVYHTFQDKKGYIWFATDMGVSRFDGYEFTNFDTDNGLTNNTVFEIFEDYHGKIWFLSLQNELSYYHKDSIFEYKYNNIITKHSEKSTLTLKRSTFIDSLNNLYLSVKYQGLLKISDKGEYTNLQKNDRNSTLRITNISNKLLVGHIRKGVKSSQVIYKNQVINIGNKDNEMSFMGSTQFFCEYGSSKQSVLIAYNNTIYKLKNNKISLVKAFENDIIWFSKDKHNKYWVSVRNNGVYCYTNSGFSAENSQQFLKNKSISSVILDKNDGHWFSTLNNGVYYLPTWGLKTISKTIGKNIRNISISSQLLLATRIKSEVLVFNKQHRFVKKIETEPSNLVNKIVYDSKINSFWIATDQFIVKLMQEEVVHTKKFKPNIFFDSERSTKSIALGLNSGVWLSWMPGLHKLQKNKLIYYTQKDSVWNGSCYSIVANANGSLWLGTLNGLWKFKNGEFIYYGKHHKLLKTRINSLFKYKNKLFVGTKGAGLIIYNINNDSTQTIDTKNGLTSNSITSITNYKNNMYIATNKGLNILNLNNDKNYQIKQFDKGNGLLSDEINELQIFDSTLYIAGKKGINYINFKQFNSKNKLINTYIEKLRIGTTDTIVKEKYELNHKQNFINISFKAISFKSKQNILYRYKMYPITTNWVHTKKNELQFTSLTPGSYTFMVSAKNKSGKWNPTNTTISFVISKPFWLSWWFIALVIALLVTLVIALINNRLLSVQKENRLKKELNLYMKKAINSQINPHFLFNTLNSINQHILKNDKLVSSKYLNRFSIYIRSVLNALKNDFQSLSEELRISELYLELEQFRLKEKLQYEIKLDKSVVSREIHIPTLIITPFLENAIWLGILPKKEPGKVQIFIFQENKTLIISIKDNGIGRKESLKLQNNPDFSLKNPNPENTLERIKLLNNLYSDKIDINYIDIDENENIYGTIVNIKIKINGDKKSSFLSN